MDIKAENQTIVERVILLAEDDHLVRNLIQNVLSVEGFTILSAVDGEEALELSRSYDGPIQLLLSDIKMPKMNGLQLIEHIIRERPETKVLLMSGKWSGEIPKSEPPISFLRKPFLAKTLRSAVNTLL
jgi:two-component system, cell cycle sensor histidine kinase and response regulator CckA